MEINKARTLAIGGFVVGLIAAGHPAAQSKPPVPPSDYAHWETLTVQPRATTTGPLSPDGRWLVYGISRQNRNNELRVVEIATGKETVLALGEQPAFSADSKWLAHAIGVTEAEEERLQKVRKPVRRKVGILNLSTGQTTTVGEIESFAFSADGRDLAMRAYPPEPPRREDADAASATDTEERDKPGSSLIVRNLASGIDTTFGNVTEYAWQSKGPLLAFAVGVEGRRGNGIHVYNPSSGSLRVLDSGDAAYSNVSWRKDAADLLVMRSKNDATRDGATQVVFVWESLEQGTGNRRVLDPTDAGVLPSDKRIVSYRRPDWSKDGRTVFVGIQDWYESADNTKTGGDGEDAAGVDVWHWKDADVIPLQKKRIATDRQRSLLAAWHLDGGALVPLARNALEDIRILDGQPRALVIERLPYAMERSIGRHYADVALVDLKTGSRTAVKGRLEDQYVQASPDGRFVLYLLDDQYWLYDVAAATHRNLTRTVPASFIDLKSDDAVKQKPPFGVGGWTKDAAAVLLYDRYDVWEIGTSATAALRLTEGTAEHIRHRIARVDPDERFIDRSAPVYLNLYGEWTKRYGYARLAPGAARPERPLWLDKRVNRLAKAKTPTSTLTSSTNSTIRPITLSRDLR